MDLSTQIIIEKRPTEVFSPAFSENVPAYEVTYITDHEVMVKCNTGNNAPEQMSLYQFLNILNRQGIQNFKI